MFLSVTGVFKMILMIIGGLVLLRFIGQLMIAKRNMDEERKLNQKDRQFHTDKNEKLKTFGKTKIVHRKDVKGDVQDVDYEEVK